MSLAWLHLSAEAGQQLYICHSHTAHLKTWAEALWDPSWQALRMGTSHYLFDTLICFLVWIEKVSHFYYHHSTPIFYLQIGTLFIVNQMFGLYTCACCHHTISYSSWSLCLSDKGHCLLADKPFHLDLIQVLCKVPACSSIQFCFTLCSKHRSVLHDTFLFTNLYLFTSVGI